MYVDNLIETSIHKPCTDNCGGLRIEPVTIEKHVDKRHVTHRESNGNADVNYPDRDKRNNTKCVRKNTVASFFLTKIRKVCSLIYTGIIGTVFSKK